MEGIWSLTKPSTANFAVAHLNSLVRLVKRKLKKIQYRPHLINGCLAATGLDPDPGDACSSATWFVGGTAGRNRATTSSST